MALLPLLRHSPIVRLRIWFADGASMDASDIGALSGLTELLIKWTDDCALRGAQLFALSSLTQLRKLCISMPGDVIKRCDMSDNVFAKLVGGLGELRELYVRLRAPLTVAALQSLGTHCPLLQDLYMAGTFALGELPIDDDNSNRPLFPNLLYLRLERFEKENS
jgi:hypothetical protein